MRRDETLLARILMSAAVLSLVAMPVIPAAVLVLVTS
jgi:hypothetical protein